MRGLAILLVILYHLGLLGGGFLGVDLFFVLSGYLITGGLLRLPDLRSFYTRRAGRLAPALLLTLCAAAIVALLDSRQGTWAGIIGGLTYSSNLLLASGQDLGVTAHLWTLAVEEQFYILWPVVLLAALRWRGRRLAARIAVGAIAAWTAARFLLVLSGASYNALAFALHYDGLMFGALVALWAPRRRAAASSSSLLARSALAVLLLLAWYLPDGGVALAEAINIPLIALLCASIIFGLPRDGAFFTSKPMVWIGRRSYGLYLYHGVLLSIAMGMATGLPIRLAAVAVSFAAAAVSFHWLEAPIRQAARDFASRFTTVPPQPHIIAAAADHA